MSESNFAYLNREGRWADFHAFGVSIDAQGQVNLRSLPLVQEELPSGLAVMPSPNGPAGVAVAPDGTVFYTFPARNELWSKHSCADEAGLIPCINDDECGKSSPLKMPRGIAVHPIRPVLIVADSGHDRLALFDLLTFQLVGEWGRTGSTPGEFSNPWTVAVDREGNVWVVDGRDNRAAR